MIFSFIAFKIVLVALQIYVTIGFEPVITEQEASSLRPGRLIVQLITEPESLIRWFEGLNLSFQMLRHWGRTGSAILRLPFNRDILYNDYDPVGLDHWKRPYYARMPTRFAAEAPRYVRMPPTRRRDTFHEITVDSA